MCICIFFTASQSGPGRSWSAPHLQTLPWGLEAPPPPRCEPLLWCRSPPAAGPGARLPAPGTTASFFVALVILSWKFLVLVVVVLVLRSQVLAGAPSRHRRSQAEKHREHIGSDASVLLIVMRLQFAQWDESLLKSYTETAYTITASPTC